MIRRFRTAFVLVASMSVASGTFAQSPSSSSEPSAADTVRVVAPTGGQETPRAAGQPDSLPRARSNV